MTNDIIITENVYQKISTHAKTDIADSEADKLPVARDNVALAYLGKFGDNETTQNTRNRLHWIAKRVQGSKVLDVGTSEGILPILLGREGFSVIGIDVNSQAIDYAKYLLSQEDDFVKDRVKFLNINLNTFDKNTRFDTVIAGEILEHVLSPSSFIERCHFHLEEQGFLILTTPFGIFPDPDHKSTFYISDVITLVSPFFQIEEIEVQGRYIRVCCKKISVAGQVVVTNDPGFGNETIKLLKISEKAFYDLQEKNLELQSKYLRTNGELSQKIKDRQTALEKLNGELNVSKQNLQQLIQKSEEVIAQYQETQKQKMEYFELYEKMKVSYENSVSECHNLRKESLEQNEQHSKVKNLYDDILPRFRDLQKRETEKTAQYAKIKQLYDELLENFRNLRQQLVERKEQYEQTKRSYEEAMLQCRDLQEKNVEGKEQYEETKRSYEEAMLQCRDLQEKDVERNEQLEQTKFKYEEAMVQCRDLQERDVKQREQLEQTKSEYEGFIERYLVLEREFFDKNAQSEKLQQLYDNISSQYDKLHKQNIERTDEYAQLKQTYLDIWGRFQTLQQKIFDRNTQLAQTQESLEQSTILYEKTFLQQQNVEKKLIEKCQQYDQMKGKYGDLLQNYRNLQEKNIYWSEKYKSSRAEIALWKNRKVIRIQAFLSKLKRHSLGIFFVGDTNAKKLNTPPQLNPDVTNGLSVGRIASSPALNMSATNANPEVPNSNIALVHTLAGDFSQNLKNLRVACIMDEFTYESYHPECQVRQVTPANWQTEVEAFIPQLLFVESAWCGKDNLWHRKVNHVASELVQLVNWCRHRGVPTIFWNKEDPVHMETFINTAFIFDYVFTTDIDCIQKYKTLLGHDRVYLLPFACQPAVHNPIEKYQRQDKFCFAGAYYKRYTERRRDFEVFISALGDCKSIDIFDRNYGKDDENYMFPVEYTQYIRGNLDFKEIDRAHKGYRYGINLNSIKQSQSMFARRVFELLASNTMVLSNYSRGIRNFFGELVINTDNRAALQESFNDRNKDEVLYRKYRLAGLRKVLSEHTYEDRLRYVMQCVTKQPFTFSLPSVTVVALVKDNVELASILRNYQRQVLENKTLVIILEKNYLPKQSLDGLGGKFIKIQEAKRLKLGEIAADGFVAGMVSEDYYGKNYLFDLVLTTRYSAASIIGKSAQYQYDKRSANPIVLTNDHTQYQQVENISARAAIVHAQQISKENLLDWVTSIKVKRLTAETCLSIDEFNYCQAGAHLEEALLSSVNDLEGLNVGNHIQKLYAIAENMQSEQGLLKEYMQLTAHELLHKLGPGKHSHVNLIEDDRGIKVVSKLDREKHQYIYIRKFFRPKEINFEKNVNFYFDVTPGLQVSLVVLFFDEYKNRVDTIITLGNRNHLRNLPENAAWVQLGIRILGPGECIIKGLFLEEVNCSAGCFINQGNYLVLSNNYPDYEDLYRNVFLHRRVCKYQQLNLELDVFQFNARKPLRFYEFENINVLSGYRDQLIQTLNSGRYRKILVHFLNEEMWTVLENYINQVQIIVWIHGFEIQPWYRRAFNINNDIEKERAILASEKRVEFWRKLFSKNTTKLHFVFVSNQFAQEVMGDLGIQLTEQQYTVIHNYIDNDLFSYIPKPVEQRKKILSIRPYANKAYANDLTVKAILLLSQETYFNELEFRLIGDGPLFKETTESLRQFNNVFIEQRFLTQKEISQIHKEYGIFLCPSRMDTQGVSRDEAMSSGLVPITNNVGAISEFVNTECGFLATAEDSVELAEAIKKLYKNPQLFQNLSHNAAQRVRLQSGIKQTIEKEMELIKTPQSLNYESIIINAEKSIYI